MKKILLLLLLLFAVACGGPEAPVTEATDSDEPEASATAVEDTDAEDAVVEDTATEDASAGAVSHPSSPTPDDFTPASTPAEAGEVRDFDHIKGATDPAVTIIEYGDYQ